MAQFVMEERNRLKLDKVLSMEHLRDGLWGARIPEGIDLDAPASQEDVLRIIAIGACMQQVLSPTA